VSVLARGNAGSIGESAQAWRSGLGGARSAAGPATLWDVRSTRDGGPPAALLAVAVGPAAALGVAVGRPVVAAPPTVSPLEAAGAPADDGSESAVGDCLPADGVEGTVEDLDDVDELDMGFVSVAAAVASAALAGLSLALAEAGWAAGTTGLGGALTTFVDCDTGAVCDVLATLFVAAAVAFFIHGFVFGSGASTKILLSKIFVLDAAPTAVSDLDSTTAAPGALDPPWAELAWPAGWGAGLGFTPTLPGGATSPPSLFDSDPTSGTHDRDRIDDSAAGVDAEPQDVCCSELVVMSCRVLSCTAVAIFYYDTVFVVSSICQAVRSPSDAAPAADLRPTTRRTCGRRVAQLGLCVRAKW
jgi:hypothetical protein